MVLCWILVFVLLVIVLLLAILLWQVKAGGVPINDTPVAASAPMPQYASTTIPPEKKVILLIAGSMPETMALAADPNKPEYKLVPEASAPAGSEIVRGVEPEMEVAWRTLSTRYADATFVADGWVLTRLWAYRNGQIEAELDRIITAKPLALVVHYVGHGDSERNMTSSDVPFLTFAKVVETTRQYPKGDGTREPVKVAMPRLGEREGKVLIDTIKAKMLQIGDIPNKILILDACEQAYALDKEAAGQHFYVTVAADLIRQLTIFARFSMHFATVVNTDCFNNYPAKMPKAVSDVEGLMGGTMSPYDNVRVNFTWRSGQAIQHPKAGPPVRTTPDPKP